jgi:diguanylate cyclase (GGDEF)-like protein
LAPDPATWRGLLLPTAFLLYDAEGRLLDWKAVRPVDGLPPTLTDGAARWLGKAARTPRLEMTGGQVTLLVAHPVRSRTLDVTGHLALYATIDDRFLHHYLADLLSTHAAAALLSNGDPRIVLASSAPERVAPGTPLPKILGRYLLGGGESFDPAADTMTARLHVLAPRDAKAALSAQVHALIRQQRLIAALLFAAAFTALIMALHRRVQRIAARVERFSERELGVYIRSRFSNNPITNLERCFSALASEVSRSRERLLAAKDADSRFNELKILEKVTDSLRVGVIEERGEKAVPQNAPMRTYLTQVGELKAFLEPAETREIIDREGQRRIFSIRRLNTGEHRLLLVTEITELSLKTEQLTRMALYDGLTGLPNRALFRDRLQHLIDTQRRNGEGFSLLMIDLDRFKEVNDTLGHSVGDELLAEVASRFSRYLRKTDTLARLGGDEFAILLPKADAAGATQVAVKLIDAQRQPYSLGGHLLEIGASIGIVACPEHGEDPEALLARADMAMYHAKRQHMGHFIYDAAIDLGHRSRLDLAADLRQAIAHGELEVHYQPQWDLTRRRIAGWEALVRWRHPRHGDVPPSEFIPLAEQSGLISEITHLVLARGIADYIHWQAAGQHGGVSINLSTRDLAQTNLHRTLSGLLERHGLSASQVTLEITESTLMQNPMQARQVLMQLSALGVRIAIDDFGTGYSSLYHLKHLPIHEIKIDRAFVHNLLRDPNDRAIVSAVISMARNLDVQVVAEGVEDQPTQDALEAMGCGLVQGYWLARPMPFDRVADFTPPAHPPLAAAAEGGG